MLIFSINKYKVLPLKSIGCYIYMCRKNNMQQLSTGNQLFLYEYNKNFCCDTLTVVYGFIFLVMMKKRTRNRLVFLKRKMRKYSENYVYGTYS